MRYCTIWLLYFTPIAFLSPFRKSLLRRNLFCHFRVKEGAVSPSMKEEVDSRWLLLMVPWTSGNYTPDPELRLQPLDLPFFSRLIGERTVCTLPQPDPKEHKTKNRFGQSNKVSLMYTHDSRSYPRESRTVDLLSLKTSIFDQCIATTCFYFSP